MKKALISSLSLSGAISNNKFNGIESGSAILIKNILLEGTLIYAFIFS